MNPRGIGLLCALSALVVGSTIGAPTSYECDVAHVYDLSPEAGLQISEWESEMRGASFSISRSTGGITGLVVPTDRAERVWVVASGSEENSFKAAAEFEVVEGNRQIQVIEVQEFRDVPEKPFVAFSMGGAGVVTGFCR